MDYPIGIHIETTGRCNSKCKFCPHDRSPRKNLNMSPGLFEKILKEAAEITNPFTITPFKLGEPLLDPEFSDRLRQIEFYVPNAKVEIHTNLNYLPKDFIPTLKHLKNVRHIWISLNHYVPRAYKQLTGLNLTRTLANIRALFDARIPQSIIIGRVADYTEADNVWLNWTLQNFPKARAALLTRGDWCQNIDGKHAVNTCGPCIRTHEISICCDGKVSLCCMDGLCEYPLGDITHQHLLEVFNSPQAVAMRNMTQRLKEPCSSCTFV
jgi:sulfatase maturation enzyme AslB (radical SAM superfamily)